MSVYNGETVLVHAVRKTQPMSPPSPRWLDVSVRMGLDGAAGRFDLDVTLAVEKGTINALVGPSGAGKTTLLRLLAGLARPDAGRLRVDGEVWCDVQAGIHMPTRRRPLGFVFQDYALFPNMTVRGNVEYALGKERRPDAVDELVRLVALEGLQDVYPERLSGGQKQRLALIRALARRPSLLLLDEPLAALDPVMRGHLQDALKRLHKAFGTTTIMVSHDTAEILRLADRVVRLENGRVVFDGGPAEALGVAGPASGLRVFGAHVDGPDAGGHARVLIDGCLYRVRYRPGAVLPAAGDAVLLAAEEVEALRRCDATPPVI
jgi:molybdate transport system ATP-binding protein